MKVRNVSVVILVVAACAIWTHDVLLFVHGWYGQKPVRNAASPVTKTEKYLYKADFPDPFFCKEFMIKKEALGGMHVRGRKKEAPVVLPECKIGGIVYDAKNPMALFVSGGKSQLVKAGDVIDSITIRRIYSDSVEVTFRTKKFCLKK